MSESFPEDEQGLRDPEEILAVYGIVRVINPHAGGPRTMTVAETQEGCPPFFNALLRATDEQLPIIIDANRVQE